ncbi:reverse transcriptase domain-containing protein [Tanacetum coccineum]
MSTREQHTPTIPTFAVRNTGGRSGPQGLEEPTSNEVLRELCDKNYHQLLPLIAEKMQKEKEQQDKLNAVKAHLLYGDESGRNLRNHEESHYSESKTPTARTELRRRHGNKHSRSPSPIASVFRRLKRNRPPSPGPRPRKEGGLFNRLGEKNKAHLHVLTTATRVPTRREPKCNQGSIITGAHRPEETTNIRRVKTAREVTGNPNQSGTGQTPTKMISLSIRRIYDGSGDPEDHLKLFQSAEKTKRWAMPTWCHMFNSTLTENARVWFDWLSKESIDSYEDLRAAFRENYLQQTKHIKDPVEIHHIKQRNGESTENLMERYKAEVLDVEGAPECMKISEFMHGITHPELIKRLYEKILRSMDEMYRVTTSFLQGEVAAFSHSRKKAPSSWRQPEEGNKPNFKKGFKNKQRSDRKLDRFSLITKTPKEIFALEKGKFKAPPPMVTHAEKRDPNKYCEFYTDTRHSMVECMQLRKQIDEMIKSGASSEVLYEHCFARLRPEIRSQMIPATTSLIGFSGETIWPIGQISLLGKDRSGIRKICAVPSTTHGMLKFPIKGGTVTLRSSRVIPMECAMISGPNTQHPVTSQVLEEKIKVAIHPEYPEQTIAIGSTLTEKGRKELCALLRQNLDVFSWKPADMTGVPRHIAEHRLNVREGCLPTRQKKRGQAPKRNKAIQEEVEKLVDARIMKEVHYHSWLSNPVMVKKHDGSWRMCVDFKYLNKACPQDGYPLRR